MFISFLKTVHAADSADISGLYNPAKFIPTTGSISDLLSQPLLRFVFILVGLFFMFNLVMAGWEFMLGSGDPKKIATATTRITNGFMGIIISMTAYVVVKIILTFLGLGGII